MKESPLARYLLEVPWQYYVTLTFGANWSELRTRTKLERIYKWLRLVSKFHRGSKKLDFRWLIAEEHGEHGGRFHVHILLADLKKPTRTHCHSMQWLWRSHLKGGFSVIRPFDRSLSGVAYVIKTVSASRARQIGRRLEEERGVKGVLGAEQGALHSLTGTTLSGCWNVSDANAYEVGKIGKGEGLLCESTVTLSSVLQDFIAGLESDKETRSLTRRGKRDKFRPWK